MRIPAILMATALALPLAACGGGLNGGSREEIKIVGSSTVFPFVTAAAEQFSNANPNFKAPIVESTGTGAGVKLFCAGVGAEYPDIVNASRRIKKAEAEQCAKNGVTEIVEIQIGLDGLAVAAAKDGIKLELTTTDLYKAIAANPFGKPNTAKTWRDVNPALPALPISVYGPPSTSGTRDSLVELLMEPGCDSDPATKALKESNADQHKDVCGKIREDGAYVDSGENDNLIVQKLAANPNSVGVFGFSFLEENGDKLKDIPINGVPASFENVATGKYPGSRPLFIYVKKAHLRAIPGLKEFVAEIAGNWGPGGYLAKRGLIISPTATRDANAAIAEKMTTLDTASLN